MCFSAPVSFVAGAALTGIGVVTLKQVKQRTEIPYALIPLIFAVQQIIEGFVWLSFGSSWMNAVGTYAFAFFAFAFWPMWLPFSLMLLEKNEIRRKILVFFFGIGLVVGLSQLYLIATEHVTSHIAFNSIVYTVPDAFWPLMWILYLMATCMSCAFSSHRWVKVFGLALFVSLLAAYRFYTVSCFSVWCFFAAILSFIVFLYFYFEYPSKTAKKIATTAKKIHKAAVKLKPKKKA